MKKVLIADDNPDNLYMLRLLLQKYEYEVVTAGNGAEALERARINVPDMVISDILMPVMDGFTLCREWKNDEKLKDIPFVFCTAEYTDTKDESLALKEGAEKFIRKPVEPDQFISIVKEVLGSGGHRIKESLKPGPEEERDIYKLYNERLINKLEQKMLHLEKEVEERKQAEEKIQRQLKRLDALHTIDMAITGSFDLKVTMNILLDQITDKLGVDAATILVLNPETKSLEFASGRGFHTEALQYTRLSIGEGQAGRAALERQTVAVSDMNSSNNGFSKSPQLAREHFIAYMASPLIARTQVRGVLELFHRSSMEHDSEWLEFLDSLSLQAAIAIDNVALFDDLQRSNVELALAYDTTIEGWAKALDIRDRETEGHSRRVAWKTVRVAREMGVNDSEIIHIQRGALLHDMGKLGIPDSILHKEGPLTEDEKKVMSRHPEYAYNMLSSIPFLRKALDIPYLHHEKWDGSGYPKGLKGNQIPLSARIFAVVDVWDALTRDRLYRKAWEKDKVADYIRSLSGTHFDPKVVDVFLKAVSSMEKLSDRGTVL